LIKRATAAGEYTEIADLEEQLARELRRIREQSEAEKERIRGAVSGESES
jgi:hypothetical protein